MHALPSIPCLGLTRRARIGLFFVGFCLSALPIGHAHAQDNASPPVTERDVQARRLFEQGREAYSDGRYRDAWAYFHEAYQLSGRPELLFNIGQTADRLGQEGDAYRAFSMYLERLPDAANRKDVENRVRALQERLSASQQAQSQPPPAAAAPTHPTPAQPAAPVAATPAPVAAARQSLPTPPTIEPHTREPRRGFLVRAAIGVGYRSDAMTIVRTNNGLQESLDANMSGFGLALDLGAGWGVAPGFAIGGGVFLDWISSPTVTSDATTNKLDLDYARLTTVGPFLDWYPVRKTLGWYILGGFGISVLSYKGRENNLDGDGYGFGLVLGTGYEFNLAANVGLGVELRFLTAILGEAVDNTTTSHVLTAPSLLASLTWF